MARKVSVDQLWKLNPNPTLSNQDEEVDSEETNRLLINSKNESRSNSRENKWEENINEHLCILPGEVGAVRKISNISNISNDSSTSCSNKSTKKGNNYGGNDGKNAVREKWFP